MKVRGCYSASNRDLSRLAEQGLFYSRLVSMIRQNIGEDDSFVIQNIGGDHYELRNRGQVVHDFHCSNEVFDTMDKFFEYGGSV